MLHIKQLTASVGPKTILKDMSYTFEKGKVYAIMGPNGSGKSTLASVVMGNPAYTLAEESRIIFMDEEIQALESHERAKKGIFLSFQTPLSLAGVTIYQLLRFALQGTREPLAIRKAVQSFAKKLKIPEELITRSLNEDFSGGEKKKMEVLQACVLDPQLLIFDEIDTGVDVDALKTIAGCMKELMSPDKTIIIITHYNQILKYVKPDTVLVLREGKIVAEGDHTMAEKIEKNGYDGI